MMRAASCHSSCMFPSSCFFSSRSAIIVIPLGSLGRRRRAKELPLTSLSMLSLFSGKKSYAYKRFGDKSATNHQESGGKGWVEISTCWLFMILKSKGSSFVKHLIQAISSKTGYYLLPLRFSWKLCDPLKTLPLPPPVDPEINKFLISLLFLVSAKV